MSKQTEIIEHEPAAIETRSNNPVVTMLQSAVATLGGEGAKDTADAIRTLVQLKREEDAIQARREFLQAFNAFQQECPPIPKDKVSRQTLKSGGVREIPYAGLDTVHRVARPLLIKHGFSLSWDSKEIEGGKLAVTCTLGHIGGHERSATAVVAPARDDRVMNATQLCGSTTAYGERYSELLVLGMATTDDTNGTSPQDAMPLEEDQVADLEMLLAETNANREKFLDWVGAASVPQIKQGDFDRAVTMLKRKGSK